MEKQQPPFCIQIEMTEGCNLFCKFCGIRGIRKKAGNYKFLTVNNASYIASRIAETGWRPRIEFAMHGEPTMNPNYIEIMRIFKKYLPEHQLMLTTNGIVLAEDKDSIPELFAAGCNIVAIDDYGHKAVKILKEQYDGVHYPKEASPYRRYKTGTQMIVFIQDVRSTKGRLVNHCGCAFPSRNAPLNRRCAKPFRELSIRWDGSVAICCNDFRGMYQCGNVIEMPLRNVWQSKYFAAARRFLYHSNRSFYPCSVCNAVSYRVGLLPDKNGKGSVSLPTKKDYENVEEATQHGSLTKPVVRPWERKDHGRNRYLYSLNE